MIQNNTQAETAFEMMIRFHNRIQAMEHTLSHIDDEHYVPLANLVVAADTFERVSVEINKDQLRGQLTREVKDMKADLKSQAYAIGEYFGV